MHIATAERLGIDDFTSSRFDQRRPPEKNCPLVFDNDGLVTHRRYIGAASSAGSENGRYLRNALGRQACLVVKNPAEMVAIGENFVLQR